MTTLQSFVPTDDNGKSHDATTEPRFSNDAFLLSLRDASQSLNRIAEHLDNGIQPDPPIDQHEKTCAEIEAIASGGDPGYDEVETMDDSTTKPTGILASVVPVPIFDPWKPMGASSTPPMQCKNLSFDAAKNVVIGLNQKRIKRGIRSWAVVIRKKSDSFGVMKLPVSFALPGLQPESNHPEITFQRMAVRNACDRATELNLEIMRVALQPKLWHVVVVSIEPTE